MLLPQVSADNYTVYVVEEGSDYKFDPEIIKVNIGDNVTFVWVDTCLLYTSPSPRDRG